jgi:hypothetical protein
LIQALWFTWKGIFSKLKKSLPEEKMNLSVSVLLQFLNFSTAFTERTQKKGAEEGGVCRKGY